MLFYDKIDDNQLIETACKFDFDNQYIKQLEDKYNRDFKKDIHVLEKSCQESFQKKMMNPRRTFEWTIEDFNKMRVSLVKFDD